MRVFSSGATRDDDSEKIDYEGFISPEVWHAYSLYMHKHRIQSDGSLRSSDNWKKGIPRSELIKSLLRHIMDLWRLSNGEQVIRPETNEAVTWTDALGGCLFNLQAIWYTNINEKRESVHD